MNNILSRSWFPSFLLPSGRSRRLLMLAVTFAVIGVLGSFLAVHPAAAEIDITSALTSINTDGTEAITNIGKALIGLAALGLVFRWVKGALF